VSCPDCRGIVLAVSRFLFDRGCNIIDSAQFGDWSRETFFLRMHFSSQYGLRLETLRREFHAVAHEFEMEANFYDASAKTRTLVMVSKFGHCLVDLLYQHRIGALPIEIPLIVSNHQDYADVAAAHGIPFCHLPVKQNLRKLQEAELSELVEINKIDLIVLARYMQILSPKLCETLDGRIINIHHSFLPSFKGARPYQQAYERGVKLIGATAHYVTSDLDDGPIIEQAVERVSPNMAPEDYAAVGRDIESVVLARAVKWHAEHRILLDGRRTIIFS